MENNKQYVGIGKTRIAKGKNGEYTILKVSFSPEHLEAINNWARSHQGWATIDITKRQSPSDKGITHTISLDTWEKPSSQTVQDNVERAKEAFKQGQNNSGYNSDMIGNVAKDITEEPLIPGVPF